MNAEVKEYLKEYKTLRVQIAKDEARLKELEEMKDEITANITDERVQSSSVGSKVEKLAIKIADLENEIADEKIRAIDRMNEIHSSINSLDDVDEQLILELRYIRRMSFADIARSLYFSASKVYRLHRNALKNMTVNDS